MAEPLTPAGGCLCEILDFKIKGDILWAVYPDRESNSDLLFRRELFYPLNYQGDMMPFRMQRYGKKMSNRKKRIIFFISVRVGMLSDSSCIMPIGGFAWLACAGLCSMLKGLMYVPLRPAAVLPIGNIHARTGRWMKTGSKNKVKYLTLCFFVR